eukprot:988371-Pelagomonas_calceolata.AAC.1
MSIRAAGFRGRFNAAVVAVKRNNKRVNGKIGDIVLQAHDQLILDTVSLCWVRYQVLMLPVILLGRKSRLRSQVEGFCLNSAFALSLLLLQVFPDVHGSVHGSIVHGSAAACMPTGFPVPLGYCLSLTEFKWTFLFEVSLDCSS